MKARLLVVEDEAYVRDSLAALLTRRGFVVTTAASVEEVVAERRQEGIDLVVSDLKLPGESGLDLVRRLAGDGPPVVVLTGHGTVTSAVECMRQGAADYLLKPVDPEELLLVVERALAARRLVREVRYLRGDARERRGELVGSSSAWRRVVEMVRVAAPVDTSVLLIGESGTGKEEAARLLHRLSARAAGPFVSVNCAAIPMELFESEFFGHRRGAFTGATSDREGRFQVADGGTLFLDEVDSLPALGQAKILRVLEDGSFERVGESRPTTVDVRLVCASNADLFGEVAAGKFRSDLFYRINVMTIRTPPLRERREDVRPLAEAFLAELATRFGRPARAFAPETLAAFEEYDWPGNVRELRNVVERAVLLERGELVGPQGLLFPRPASAASAASAGAPNARLPAAMAATPEGEEDGDLHLRTQLVRTERRLLAEALARAGGVKRQAARLLGIDERNLGYFLRKHGLGPGPR
jgi:DNA-binding NtrC family response regulator